MASMVAKACGSTSSQIPYMAIHEKGSRNKRKFRADPPLTDQNTITPSPLNECTNFDFSAEKFEIIQNLGNAGECDMSYGSQDNPDALKLDLGLSCNMEVPELVQNEHREEILTSSDDFHDADWSDLTESQLEEFVLSNLDTIFRSAIKQITASGYSEEVSLKAILRSGLWYGCKDTVSNIVDNTLAFLRNGQDIDPSKEYYFEDLQQMEKYILAELVCLLREVRPFFSVGDAMWCLLICDMNVSHACVMDSDPLGNFLADIPSNGNSSISAQTSLRIDPKSYASNYTTTSKPNVSSAYTHTCSSAIKDGHSLQYEESGVTNTSIFKPKPSIGAKERFADDENQDSTSLTKDNVFGTSGISHATATEEKFVANRKISGINKRENILRQKSNHFEKHFRTYGSRGTSRSGKLSSFGGLVLDKKLKAVAESTGVNGKNGPFKINKIVDFDGPQDTVNQNLLARPESTSVSTFGSENNTSSFSSSKTSTSPLVSVDTSSSSPVTDTELSLSLNPAKSNDNSMFISHNSTVANSNYIGAPNDRSLDRKDETIMKLAPRVRELQNQLQEWTEWANQKVMQAARRLSEDKADLKKLRQEKEEAERLKKEKQTVEENTMKKLSEMENALRKASGQVERANAAVRRLEVENAALWKEMESAKLHAAETAASCEEVSSREKSTLLKFQSWEKQKTVLQEELLVERQKLKRLQQELQQGKDTHDQIEAKLNQEEKEKDDALALVSSLRKETEQIEETVKSKEQSMKVKAESNLQKYNNDIGKLEKKISQLTLKSDSSKIAALKRGIDGSYASKVTHFRRSQSLQDSTMSYVSSTVTSTILHKYKGDGVKRERECAMCLSEEMSIVFLPCAHQVVCAMCSELHEKQGMKDCPSCRSPIQQRVLVRYARH